MKIFSDVALAHRYEGGQKHYILSALLIHVKRVLSMIYN